MEMTATTTAQALQIAAYVVGLVVSYGTGFSIGKAVRIITGMGRDFL